MAAARRGAAKLAACPTCGKDLTWIPQYDRFYCYAEKKYAPKGYTASSSAGPAIPLGGSGTESHVGHYHCPSCGGELTFITQYDRYYCYAENKYAPKDLVSVSLEPIVETAAEAPTAAPTWLESATPPTAEAPKVEEPIPSLEPAAPTASETPTVVQERPMVEPEVAAPAPVEPFVPESSAIDEGSGTEETGKRPALKRSRIRIAKKSQLEEWSRAYGLSTKGNRETLRNRLLKYMDDQGIVDREEVTLVEAAVLTQEAPLETSPEAIQASENFPPPEPEPVVPEATPTTPPEPELTETTTPWPEPAPETQVQQPETFVPATADREREPTADTPTRKTESESASLFRPRELELIVHDPELRPEPVQEPTAPATERIPALEPKSAEAPPPVRVVEAATPPPREVTPSLAVEPLPPMAKVAPAAKPAEPLISRVEVAKALSCPNCGRELTYISRYDRLYCFSCGRYAPKGYGRDRLAVEAPRPSPAPVAAVAPTVQAVRAIEAPKVVEARPENVCPTCGRTMRYVKEYQRWWCDAERKYAARRVKNPCPTCGKELSYVRTYDRWYCSYEKKYAPKSYQAAVSATVASAPAATPAVAAQTKLARASAAVAATPAVAVAVPTHAHKKPLAGIALVSVGFSLVIVWFLIGTLGILGVIGPTALGLEVYQLLAVLGLIGLVLAMAGTILGLSSVRAR